MIKIKLFASLIFLNLLWGSGFAQTIIGRQKAITLPTSPWASGVTNALVWLPADYNSANTYPLIISLHGVGEAGAFSPVTNLNKLIANNGSIPSLIAGGFNATAVSPVDGKTYEFIVVSPQSPSWSYGESQLAFMLPQIEKLYSIDKNRIYITGYSAGGWGTWTSITDDTTFAKQIAAIAPMSAATLEPTRSPNVVNSAKFNIPVYVVINNPDINGFTPPNQSYVAAINKINPKVPAGITLINTSGHNAWFNGYNPNWKGFTVNGKSYNLYEWLLLYSKNPYVAPAPLPQPTPLPSVIHDTITITKTVTNTVHDTITITKYDTVRIHDTTIYCSPDTLHISVPVQIIHTINGYQIISLPATLSDVDMIKEDEITIAKK